ncbi:MAG: SRPBCC family protein, partial [Planctomycetaceae bacterium]|nr:SRPBCC family protein [Planctomycetaceae bacterium]
MPKFHVSRSIEIAAPPEKVFEVVSDFKIWPTWSPWLIADPEAKITTSENSNSVGSTYAWEGTATGSGEMEHQKLDSPRRIESEIRFLKPWKSKSSVSFDLEPTNEGTRISWNMDGSMPFFMFWMIKMMEVWVGCDYERGLAMLKAFVETGQVNSRVVVHGKDIVESIRMVGIRRKCGMKEIGTTMEEAIVELHKKMETAGLRDHGEMMSVYHSFNMKRQETEFTVGYIIPDSETTPDGLEEWSTLATPAFYVEHIGAHHFLGNGW